MLCATSRDDSTIKLHFLGPPFFSTKKRTQELVDDTTADNTMKFIMVERRDKTELVVIQQAFKDVGYGLFFNVYHYK